MNKKDLQNPIREFLSKDGNSPITEANLTKVQLDKREDYLKQLKKNKKELVKRYGKDAESVMYGRATNLAKKAVSEMDKQKLKELVRKSLMNEDKEFTEEEIQNTMDTFDMTKEEAIAHLQQSYSDYKQFDMKEGKKEDVTGDGKIDSKDYLAKRDIAITKAVAQEKGEVKEDQYIDGLGTIRGVERDMGKVDPTTVMISKTYSNLLDLHRALVNTIAKTHPEVAKDQKIITYFNGINTVLKDLKKYLSTQNSLKEDIDLGHEDNEPHMIKGELYQIGKYAMKLYATLEELEETGQEIDFPAWWQSKITTAKNMMSGARHYLDFELKEPAIDAAVDALTGEAPHMGEPEPPMMEAEGNLKQDIVDFWDTQQDDAAQSDGEYEAEWDTEFFIDNYPQYEGKEQEINNIVKTLQINEAEIGKDEILAGKIMKALKDMANKDASDQNNLKQARTALNKGNMSAAEKIAKPYLSEKIAKQLKSK